ncbi:uncharacterized protein LOC119579378 [Penaeus monodon]|uniref:uncharacterized protein LOC119579378 n=1 Tax=Penaeus monodon TaxID=6687 RepID=UPI0018A6F42B|nr:uncharacterized protein LOC119579378 [Penaeus monodon]
MKAPAILTSPVVDILPNHVTHLNNVMPPPPMENEVLLRDKGGGGGGGGGGGIGGRRETDVVGSTRSVYSNGLAPLARSDSPSSRSSRSSSSTVALNPDYLTKALEEVAMAPLAPSGRGVAPQESTV